MRIQDKAGGSAYMSSTTLQKTGNPWLWRVWWQWILANAIGETIGLGATLLVGAFLLGSDEE